MMNLVGLLNYSKIKAKDVFICILLSSILIDILNGFFATKLNLNIPISQFFKLSLLLFFISYYSFIKCNLKYILITLVFIIVLFIPNLTIHVNNMLNQSYFTEDFIYSVKIIYFPIMYMGFKTLFYNKSMCDEKSILWLLNFIFIVIFLSMLFSIIGFGNTQYGEHEDGVAFGYKGYFISGNELSYLFLVAYSFSLHRIILYGKKASFFIFYLIVSFVTAVFLATKTAMLAFILISIFQTSMTFWYYNKSFDFSIRQRLRKIKYIVVFLSIPAIGILSFFLYKRLLIYVSRLDFLFHQQGGTITSFLLSGRNHRYLDLLEMFVHKMNIIDWLFGIGRISYVNYTFGPENQYSAEMDLIDSLISNGLIGSLIIYSVWIYFLLVTFKSIKNRVSNIAIPTFLSLSLLFLISFIAGHVFASPMVLTYIALVLAYLTRKGQV